MSTFSLLLECSEQEKERIIADLWEKGTTGVVEEDLPGGRCRLRSFFPGESRDAERLASEFAGRHAEWREEPETDWTRVFEDSWAPFPVGERFYLVPSWRTDAAPHGRVRLDIYPGLAYGTGLHESTQMSLEALERHLRAGDVVLDVGTGSGILASGALMLGASRVFACDIDPQAVRTARANYQLDAAAFFSGSVRSVRSRAVDLVVANINAHSIVALMDDIVRALRPGGMAILAGFRGESLEHILAEFDRRERAPADLLERNGWMCLVVR